VDSVRVVSPRLVCQQFGIRGVFAVSYWIHHTRIAEWDLLRRLRQRLRPRFSDRDLHGVPHRLLPRCQYTDAVQSLRSRLLCQCHGLVCLFCMRNWKVHLDKSRNDLHCVCCGYICVIYSLNAVHALLCSLRFAYRWIVFVFFLRSGHATQLLVDVLGVFSVDL